MRNGMAGSIRKPQDMRKRGKLKRLDNGRDLHREGMVPALVVIMAEDGPTDDGQIGVHLRL